jgi:4-hydroxy-3-methylbut-2-enyl diphosphate reductase
VHNETVLKQLRSQGVKIEHQVADVTTPTVLITAHGTSARTLNQVRAHGLRAEEATCPLVRHAHQSVDRLVAEGFHPVIIGRRDHVEVRGVTDDLDAFDVVLTEDEVATLRERPRFGVVAQTTQPLDKVRYLVELIRRRFPSSEVRFIDTVCQPTKQRQTAAIELARQSDVVVVIGGAHSNNTRELAATCARFCPRVCEVQSADEMKPDWFANTNTVGITAGTSTPDEVIDGVERWLREFDEFQSRLRQTVACQTA